MRTLLAVAFIVVVVGAGALLLMPGQDPAASFPEDPPTDGVLSEATVEQILRDPAAFQDQAVLVRGAAALPLGREGAFVLQSDGNRILVYAPNGLPRIDPGKSVGIRGEVVRFTEPAAELLGDALDDPAQLSGVPTEKGDPYLLFRALAPGQAGAAAPAPDLRRARERLAAVAANPGTHYGDAVTVAGEVARAGRRNFVLEVDGEELLVVPQSPVERDLRVGVPVRAKGIVVPVDPDLEDDVLDEGPVTERYDGRASLAATAVTVFEG